MGVSRFLPLPMLLTSLLLGPSAVGASPETLEDRSPETRTLEELRQAHFDLWRLETRAAHPQGRPASAAERDSLKQRLDALFAETASLKRAGVDTPERKRRAVERLLTLDADTRAPQPVGARLGAESCADAEDLEFGSWLVPRHREEKTGDAVTTRWFRLPAIFDGRFTVDTLGSSADTRLTVFQGCAGRVVAESDDAFGLTSRLGFDAAPTKGARDWLLKVEAAGPGHLQARVAGHGRKLTKGTQGSMGNLSGLVSDNGAPLPSISMTLLRLEGSWYNYSFTYTDTDGRFSFSDLPTGTYKVRTDFYTSSPYLNQIFPAVSCPSICRPDDDGDPIEVDGTDRADIDFPLERGGVIRGWVQDVEGVGISDARVSVWNEEDDRVRTLYSDAAGRYEAVGLAAGSYRVAADKSMYLGQGWGGTPCLGNQCSSPTGDLIPVTLGAAVEDIDFRLTERAQISGTVLFTGGEAVHDAAVTVYDAGGRWIASTRTDSAGGFSVGGLPEGQIYVKIADGLFSSELWMGVPCPNSCDPTTGTPIIVADGMTTDGIDFVVEPYGTLLGTIHVPPGAPDYSGLIEAYDSKGAFVGNDYVDYTGTFRIDLPAGVYTLVAPFSGQYEGQVWDNRPCADGICDPADGDPVLLAAGDTVDSIDFDLERRAGIYGSITTDGSGSSFGEIVHLFDSTGRLLYHTTAYGNYAFTGLDAGTYYVGIFDSQVYQNQLYDGLACADPCDPLNGTPIVVSAGEQVQGIDFALVRAGEIRGRMTFADGGTVNYLDMSVSLYDAAGTRIETAFPTSTGNYAFQGLEAGDYYLVGQAQGYMTQLWQGTPCDRGPDGGGCTVTDGTAVSVALEAVQEVNFVMDPAAVLSGRVTDEDGEPVYSSIQVFDAAGALRATAYSESDGAWRVSGLATGQYRVGSVPQEGHFMSLAWPMTYCSGGFSCTPFSGSQILATSGSEVGDVDFIHNRLGTISGRLTGADTGAPLPQIHVEARTLDGVFASSASTDENGDFTLPGLAADAFYVHTRGNQTWSDRVFGGGLCELDCSGSGGTAIHLALFEDRGDVDFTLRRSRGVRGHVRSRSSGAGLPGVAVDFWNESGVHQRTVVTDVDGRFEAFGESYGLSESFYISTQIPGSLGLVDTLWGDVACPDGPAFLGLCDPTSGTLIELREDTAVRDIVLYGDDGALLFRSGFENGLDGWSSP